MKSESNKPVTMSDFDANGLKFGTLRELHDAVRDLREISHGARTFAVFVTFTKDTFRDPYTAEQRTYVCGSNAPYFGGEHFFPQEPCLVGDALTDDDPGVYLLENIEGKFGGKWKVESCCIPSKGGYLLPVARVLPSARVSFAHAVANEVYRNMTISKASEKEAAEKAKKAVEGVMNDSHPFWLCEELKLEGTPFPEDAEYEKRNPGTKKRRAKREAWLSEHKSYKDFAPKPAPEKAKPAKGEAGKAAKQPAPDKGAGKRATATATAEKAKTEAEKGRAMARAAVAAALAKKPAPKPAPAKPKADPKHEKRLPEKAKPTAKKPTAKPAPKPAKPAPSKGKKPAKK